MITVPRLEKECVHAAGFTHRLSLSCPAWESGAGSFAQIHVGVLYWVGLCHDDVIEPQAKQQANENEPCEQKCGCGRV